MIITKEDVEAFKEESYRKHRTYAQMVLGYRYKEGIGGMNAQCRASFLYY